MVKRMILAAGMLVFITRFAAAQTTAPAIAPAIDLTNQRTLYVVGYAHLDTQWRWAYPQVIREYIAETLRNNFPLIDKYPHYIFNFSGSRRYQMMKEYYPAEYEKLRGYVKAGRWFPCGSSVDENDANVPSAESLVRHVLYGNHYFRREFGVASDEFMLPDCFGFPAALPSVLAHCGIRGFSTQKLTWGSAVGIPFKVGVWAGPDDRSVIAALDPGAYVGKVKENLAQSESWKKRIEVNGQESGVYTDYHYYGTGDRGGAPAEESVEWIEKSVTTKPAAVKKPSTKPGAEETLLKVVSSHADWMFNAITDEQRKGLPRYKGELLLTEHSSGSITSAAYMKRWNRKNELLADAAERASVAAAWLGAASYPAKKLEDAWTLVLGSQMHDILPGTSLPKAYEYSWNDEVLALNQFAAVAQDAAGAVSAALDTRGEGVALVVYNPLSIAREDVVEATVKFLGAPPASVKVVDGDGHAAAAQVIGKEAGALKILFLAKAPSVGFAVYDVRPGSAADAESELKVDQGGLENARYRVKLDENGDVAGIFDKQASHELLSAPARLAFLYENPRNYPAWNMDWNDRKNPPRAYVTGPAKVRVVENGPVRVALEVERESQGSRFVQRIRLAAGSAGERIEFDNHIDWSTRESSLKAVFPMAVANPKAVYDIQVGTIERGNNEPKKYEVPQHKWIDLTDAKGDYGVSVLNDCKYGSDKPDNRTVRLTLLYTPGTRGGFQDQGTQDTGKHDILYALCGHEGDWRAGKSQWQAARLNQPMLVFQSPAHEGTRGKTISLATVSSDHVAITAMKKAEDSDETIVRLKELHGTAAVNVRVKLAGSVVAAREVDGQEREIGSAIVRDGELVANVPAYQLRAFALKLAPAPHALPAIASQPLELPFDADVVSTDAKPDDGAFATNGQSLAAEQLPKTITSEGVEFTIGSSADGHKNALTCNGQTIQLPTGDFQRLYLIAAADGDAKATFDIDGHTSDITVQNWTGYIGQWDNRLWKGDVPETAFKWTNELAGLAPGYIKRDTVAWFCSHVHTPGKGNAFYQYSYLYKYGFDLPAGAKTLTLPRELRIKILAATLVNNAHDQLQPAYPLYDTLEDHTPSPPRFVPDGGEFADSTTITIAHPTYWRDGDMRYTTDGSDPTAKSPVYIKPLTLSASATIKSRTFDAAAKGGPIATATFNVHDTTPPTVRSATAFAPIGQIRLVFSEPLDPASAQAAENYQLDGDGKIDSASLADGGITVTLKSAQPLATTHALKIAGVKDRSPGGNAMADTSVEIKALAPVFTRDTISKSRSGDVIRDVAGLPVHARDPWTINVLVRVTRQPENRTLIAGFGAVQRDAEGKGRYLAKFANGVHFWSERRDVESTTKLDVGPDTWQMLSATYDGQVLRLYKNAKEIAHQPLELADDEPVVHLAAPDPWDNKRVFDGDLKDFTIWNAALSPEALEALQQSTNP